MAEVVRLYITADSKPAIRAIKELVHESNTAERKLKENNEKTSKSFERVGESAHRLRSGVSLLAGAVGLGGLAFGIKDAVQAASKWQTQQASLQQALKATGQYSAATMKALSDAAEGGSVHGGFAAPQELAAIQQFTTETGRAGVAVKLNTEAMNLARGAHIDYSRAVLMVGAATAGTTGRIAKYIGPVLAVTSHTAGWTAKMKQANPVLYAHEQLLNKLATAQEINARIQQRFGGQMQAFSRTSAGAISNLKNSLDVIAVKIGTVLLPIVAKVAHWLLGVVTVVTDHWPQIKRVASQVFGVVKVVFGDVISVVRSAVHWFTRHKDVAIALGVAVGGLVAVFAGLSIIGAVTTAIEGLVAAFTLGETALLGPVIAIVALGAGLVYLYLKVKAVREIVSAVFGYMKTFISGIVRDVIGVFKGLVQMFTGVWQVIKGVFTLNAGELWTGLKNVFGGGIKFIVNAFKLITAPIRAVWQGIKTIIGDVINWIVGAVRWLVGKVTHLIGQILSPFKAVGHFLGGIAGGAFHAIGSLFGGGPSAKPLAHRPPGRPPSNVGLIAPSAVGPILSHRSPVAKSGMPRNALDTQPGTGHIAGQQGDIVHHSHTHLSLDGRQIAESVARYSYRKAALS